MGVGAQAAAARLDELRSLLAARGLTTGRPVPAAERERLAPTGLAALDALLGGGFPRGEVSECYGPDSAGRASLALAFLAQATARGETAAYVDAADSLDLDSAQRAGVDLERLLWVRCAGARAEERLAKGRRAEPAWSAMNLTASAGGFGAVVLDLCGLPRRRLRSFQNSPWAAPRQAVSGSPAAIVVFSPEHVTSSCAARVVELRVREALWRERGPGLLDGVAAEARLLRGRGAAAGRAGASCSIDLLR